MAIRASATSWLIGWNRRLVVLVGSDVLFAGWCVYFGSHLLLLYLALYTSIGHSSMVLVKSLTESLACSHLAVRLYLLRRHGTTFQMILDEMSREQTELESQSQIRAFMRYEWRAARICRLLVGLSTFTFIVYYIKPLLMRRSALRAADSANSSLAIPDFPIGFYRFHEITSAQSYAITYASQAPFLLLCLVTQASVDCLVVSLACYLCGHLSALAQRVHETELFRGESDWKLVIRIHQRLLWVGKEVEKSLSGILFCHLFVASTLIGIVVLQILISMAPEERGHLINSIAFLCIVLFRLFSHCWVGEYLIEEGDVVRAAFYGCGWENMSPKCRKLVILNLLRSEHPIRLSAGGFGTFSRELLTQVIKTAMAYVSFLRNFI